MPRLSLLLLLAQLIAFTPVWQWGLRRVTDPADEPWCLIALLAAVALSIAAPIRSARRPLTFGAPCVLTLAYALLFPLAPPLGRAFLALSAIGATLAAMRGDGPLHPARIGLFLLATPLVPTLQFLGGYPMRVASGSVAELLLRLGGVAVVREGTLLRAGGMLVAVDAPCSGIRMLWAGLFLACVASWLLRLRGGPTLACLAATVAVVVIGNGVRAATLFYSEAGLVALPPAAHGAIGIVVFVFVGVAVVLMATDLRRRTCAA